MSQLPNANEQTAALFDDKLNWRKKKVRIFRWLCLGMTFFGVLALAALLLYTIGGAFTWSIVEPREVRGRSVPNVVESWSLWEGLYNRDEIERIAEEEYPEGELQFYSWIDWDFLTSFPSRFPELAGFRTPIIGSVLIIGLTALLSVPIGIGAAVYLEEYGGNSLVARVIETNIANLAGVPSIIYGLLGLAIFVRAWDGFTGGRTILAGALTMTLLGLPVIIVAAREALRAVPPSFKQGSLALGATKWETIRHHVLPAALPGMLTGAILAMSRAIGETAPLITIGALTYVAFDPSGLRDVFTVMPIQIFNWVSQPQEAYHHLSSAGILVLLAFLLTMNAIAVIIRRKTERTY